MLGELSRYTLHGRDCLYELDDVSFVGFGASSELMSHFIPQDLEINFSGQMAYNYLSQFSDGHAADVCITHCPPYRAADFVTIKGEDGKTIKNHIGDLGILAYLLECQPTVVLCGHAHNPLIQAKGKTVVINSGNLGRYHNFTDSEQIGPSGSMALVTLDDNTFFDKAEFYQLTDVKKGLDSITRLGGMQLNKNTHTLEQR
jgi:Icc-related predicted phosphoesterase